MAKPAQRRWACPDPEHAGVLAPSKMRMDDTRRFCWPCSERKGRLVERVCVVRETRARAAGDRAAKLRAAAKAERDQAADLVKQGRRARIDRLKRLRRMLIQAKTLSVWKEAGRVAYNAVRLTPWVISGGADWSSVESDICVGLVMDDTEAALKVLRAMATKCHRIGDGETAREAHVLMIKAAGELWKMDAATVTRMISTFAITEAVDCDKVIKAVVAEPGRPTAPWLARSLRGRPTRGKAGK